MVHAPQVVTQADAVTEVKEEETEETEETNRDEKGILGSIVKAVGITAVADKVLGRDKRQVN